MSVINITNKLLKAAAASPPTVDVPIIDWVKYYLEEWGFALTPTKPHTKNAYLSGWQKNPIVTVEDAERHWKNNPFDGIGLVLGASELVSFDIDEDEHTKVALEAVGINLDGILNRPEATKLQGMGPKTIYRMPKDVGESLEKRVLKWINQDNPSGKPITIFELRTGRNYDVLPPSIHPDTHRPYEWLTPPWDQGFIPALPEELLELWLHWDEKLPLMNAACPWVEEAKVKQAIVEYSSKHSSPKEKHPLVEEIRYRVPLDEMLKALGAVPRGKGKYLCPFHEDHKSSFWTFTAEEGYDKWVCAHGIAPVGLSTANGYSIGDVIDLYQYNKNIKTRRAAMVEIANEVGIEFRSFEWTDVGNAERLVFQHGDNIRYISQWKCWLIWDGKRWKEDESFEIMRLAKRTVRSIYADAEHIEEDDCRKNLIKFARRSEARQRLEAMIDLAKSEADIPIQTNELDKDVWLINCENGTINLKTGELQPHRREDFITKMMQVAYEPNASCSLWKNFIQKVMNNDVQRICYLQKALGYALTGDTSEQCLFMLIGSGANGKSVLLETIQEIMGTDYAKSTITETILHKDRQAIPNDLARLVGTRMVIINEVDEGRRMAESLVKQMTGNDTITARFLHCEFFDFVPQFKLFIRANHKPIIYGADNAIWRRIRIIPFDVTIPEEERDHHLKEKLREEFPGILNWLLQGCLLQQQEGLHAPAAVVEATDQYKKEMDTVKQFIDECVVKDAAAEIQALTAFECYEKWCENNGERTVTNTMFGRRMTEYGFTKEKKGGRFIYQGFTICAEALKELALYDLLMSHRN